MRGGERGRHRETGLLGVPLRLSLDFRLSKKEKENMLSDDLRNVKKEKRGLQIKKCK